MEVAVVTSPYPGQSFSVKPGDFVVVRLPANESIDVARQSLEALVSFLQQHGIADVQIIAIPTTGHVECLDEAQMREIGWVRG